MVYLFFGQNIEGLNSLHQTHHERRFHSIMKEGFICITSDADETYDFF